MWKKIIIFASHNPTGMEIRQLRYFVNAAHALNFTEAARLSNVAQSTLSQQIKQLEMELGVPLFHRTGKHVSLSAEGLIFLEDAKRILNDARQGLQRLADLGELREGSVSLGIASGLGLSELLAETLTIYNKAYPHIRFKISQVAAPLLPEKLRQHELDLALTFTPHTLEESILVEPLFDTPLCAIVSEQHTLAALPTVSIRELIRHPLVLPSQDLQIRQHMDAAALSLGLILHPTVQIDDLSHIVYMVRRGRWVSILPDAASRAVKGVVRIPIEERAATLHTSVLTLEKNYQGKAVREFLRLMHNTADLLLKTRNND